MTGPLPLPPPTLWGDFTPRMADHNIEMESIWGNTAGTIVYAQVFNQDCIVIFRFEFDLSKQPQNIINRIVTCFHDIDVEDASATYIERDDMRDAVMRLVHQVWPVCTKDLQLLRPDALVELTAPDDKDTWPNWSILLDPSYSTYFQLMKDCQEQLTSLKVTQSVEFASLQRSVNLGGHGSTTKVTRDGQTMVFKGIDFALYLICVEDNDDGSARSTFKSWANELDTLRRLPPHPNIQPLPSTLVTISKGYDTSSSADYLALSEDTVVCGHLMPYYPRGDMASLISDVAETEHASLPISTQARWCFQMTSAVKHAHDHGEYHKDLKPGNMLITSNDDVLLIDWEQALAPAITIAPEADGTWDVSYADDSPSRATPITPLLTMLLNPTPRAGVSGERPKLKYTKYAGPPRRNQPENSSPHSWDAWNVFPSWQKECPLALELAEVFSLGRTMWMLLNTHAVSSHEVDHPDELTTEWKQYSNVPQEWREMVDKCLSKNPNERPRLVELESFWRAAMVAAL